MRCNTPRMNSWHSFSPNGRWLVFSSKARSPYTQMYLTHIDEEGNDTPPILIENSTAANRAVNLPEFVNVPPGGLHSVGGPALEYYRLYDRALFLEKAKRYDDAATMWKSLLEIAPKDQDGRRHLGMVLLLAGRRNEAAPFLQKGNARAITPLMQAIQRLESGQEAARLEISPQPTAQELYYLALVNLRQGDKGAAITQLRQAVEKNPAYAEAHQSLAEMAEPQEALKHWRITIDLRPNHSTALRRAAWILATDQKLRNGSEAVALAVRAMLLTESKDAMVLETLAAAYAEANRFDDAIETAQRAIAADPESKAAVERRIARYRAGLPWRE